MLYKSVEELIGQTPLLELNKIKDENKLKGNLIAKLEYGNPGGSVKDRVAREMILDFERRGLLHQGSTIIEPTSGNTGIGLALMAAIRGIKAIITMPDTMSVERIKLMKAYGAKVVLTPGKEGMNGAIRKAEELHKEIKDSIIAGQFVNEANPLAHYNTTGKEIYEDLAGKVDIFVAGIGTGGTITGVGRFLKEKNKDIKIIGVEPDTSPVITKGTKGAHGIQGIGAGFIPDVLDLRVVDEVYTCSVEDAYKAGREMGLKEGILVGISSGAALAVGKELALKEENKDKNIVVLLPDGGNKYLSTPMYEE